ncbi:hypothetical protein S40285_09687 [Stachybotrys chlorohalonatus IBT 40285]|uniref:NmrA-like domain-containing protein n=1 Tax=Stachybotrys chlorohalonatus (strain IBT 40285) TaxID=1283841 RepID=A0A084QW22_STAC4|nr:hypothetical protein S40285_09687 [Stachybotrys chlorohalonata IBT 40285]
MHIFITGASGNIGKAVTKELLGAGHTILALARSDEAAKKLVALGAEVQKGSLHDLDVLKKAASASDGVIHLGFIHDFSNWVECCQTDRVAIQAMADGLAGTNRPLIMTSGTLMFPRGQPATEDDTYDASSGPFEI